MGGLLIPHETFYLIRPSFPPSLLPSFHRAKAPFLTVSPLLHSLAPSLLLQGRNYARALFLTAAVQGLALLIENEWDSSIYFVYACCLAMGLQNSLTSKYRYLLALPPSLPPSIYFVYACCLAMGLQNSLTSKYR